MKCQYKPDGVIEMVYSINTGQREVPLNKKRLKDFIVFPCSNPENGNGRGKEASYKCKVDTTEFLIDPLAAATIQ